ncbi:uncharacterized protein PHALS_07914 [Plasmopara halstedii]|uniref:Transmembrane protein n=1 Tax=Plasmopara halstedii TaxID=4781 RepID=A0A0P1B8D8_PLAHL|nr:uncharacterized protein PHALS_07914 [Plasmopara halstedii]CEG50189.1 hypothetical protein PHALS_07914 [Plasmopara halstedii]|eukprot:XP_024586558.1 hypothetical protein PHALS_07914 [Plasmopara halstedii]
MSLTGVLFGLIRDLMRMYPHDQYKCVEDGATAELSLSRLIFDNFTVPKLHAAVALLSLAFVALLSGSPSAFRLSRLLHENTKWCEEKASDMSRFFHDITILRSCALLLVIFITIAWLLFALQCSLTMTLRNTNSSHVAELQEELADLKTRLCKLQGSYLERLSAEELRSLIQLHQRAIEQTENALVLQLQASI